MRRYTTRLNCRNELYSNTFGSGTTYYVRGEDGAGCIVESSVACAQTTVSVNANPTVNLAAFSAVCLDASAFALTGGTPSGGTYSGTGVSAGNFDPASAGVGLHTITYDYTDGNGCSGSAQNTIQVNDCAGIQDLAAYGVSVYPIPMTNELIVRSGVQIYALRLFDAAGRLVYDAKPQSTEVTIQVSTLSEGVYHLLVDLGSGLVLHQKIVK